MGKFEPAGERPAADNSPQAAGTFRPEQTRGYATMLGFSVIEMRSSEWPTPQGLKAQRVLTMLQSTTSAGIAFWRGRTGVGASK
jgi:hypothetical protein